MSKCMVVNSLIGQAILLRPNSRQSVYFLSEYYNSANDDIHDVYKKPSDEKISACARCRARMNKVDGSRFRITSHNCHTFSVGFSYVERNGDTYVCYITAQHTYLILEHTKNRY